MLLNGFSSFPSSFNQDRNLEHARILYFGTSVNAKRPWMLQTHSSFSHRQFPGFSWVIQPHACRLVVGIMFSPFRRYRQTLHNMLGVS